MKIDSVFKSETSPQSEAPSLTSNGGGSSFFNKVTSPTSSLTGNSIKNQIAKKESNGDYRALNLKGGGEGAVGKYQFRYKLWKDKISQVTGVKDRESFRNNPEAQEQFMDWYLENEVIPNVSKVKSKDKYGLTDSEIAKLIHFRGVQGAEDYVQGDLNERKESYNMTANQYLGRPKHALGAILPLVQTGISLVDSAFEAERKRQEMFKMRKQQMSLQEQMLQNHSEAVLNQYPVYGDFRGGFYRDGGKIDNTNVKKPVSILDIEKNKKSYYQRQLERNKTYLSEQKDVNPNVKQVFRNEQAKKEANDRINKRQYIVNEVALAASPVPVVGEILGAASGIANGVVDLAQGEYGNAALSAIPYGISKLPFNKLNKITKVDYMSLDAPMGNMVGENQVLIQQQRLLNPEIKKKFFTNQAPEFKASGDILEKVPKDYNNRITSKNYNNFIKDIHSRTDYDKAASVGKQPHNLGSGNYGMSGIVYSDAPLNNLGKDIINAHEKNHGVFAGTLSTKMKDDLLSPFGTVRPVPHYQDKMQADEVLARMGQFKNAAGIGDNQTFTLGHLNLVRKNYTNNFLDNGITEMLSKIKPGSDGEKKFLENMNKYAFGLVGAGAVGALQNKQKFQDGGEIPQYEVEKNEVVQGQANIKESKQLASDIHLVKGRTHEEGGVVGEGGDRVFSNRLSPSASLLSLLKSKKINIGVESSYADVAKKLGLIKSKFEGGLGSFNPRVKNTAKAMLGRTNELLDVVFQEQEQSKSIPVFAYGGKIKYDKGGKPTQYPEYLAPEGYYTVRKGDWLSSIAKNFGFNNYMDLQVANKLKNPDVIKPGDRIKIPSLGEDLPVKDEVSYMKPRYDSLTKSRFFPPEILSNDGRNPNYKFDTGVPNIEGMDKVGDKFGTNTLYGGKEGGDVAPWLIGAGTLADLFLNSRMKTKVDRNLIPNPGYTYADRSGLARWQTQGAYRTGLKSLDLSTSQGVQNNAASMMWKTQNMLSQINNQENQRKDEYNRSYADQVWRTQATNVGIMNEKNDIERGLQNQKLSNYSNVIDSGLQNINTYFAERDAKRLEKDKWKWITQRGNLGGRNIGNYLNEQ